MARSGYDFCGWATRYGVKCSDGRTILKGAFADQDGKKVSLVYNHDHKSITNVLGHGFLEHRDEGEYFYGYLNRDTIQGEQAYQQLMHGDISTMSIFANHLNESNGYVKHGEIKEVSLVLAGANPGANIESVIAHSDEDGGEYGEGVIYNEDEFVIDKCFKTIAHDDTENEEVSADENQNENVEESIANETDETTEAESKSVDIPDWDDFTEEQQNAITRLCEFAKENINIEHSDVDEMSDEEKQIYEDLAGLSDDEIEYVCKFVEYSLTHSDDIEDIKDDASSEDDEKSKTYEQVSEKINKIWDTFTEEEKGAIYTIIGNAIQDIENEGSASHSSMEEGTEIAHGDITIGEIFDNMSDEKKEVAEYIIAAAIMQYKDESIKHDDIDVEGEENTMQNNGFENNKNVLTEEDQLKLFKEFGEVSNGTFKQFCKSYAKTSEGLAHADIYSDIEHLNAIAHTDQIDVLRDDYKKLRKEPDILNRDEGWVSAVLDGVDRAPFGKVKTQYTDITEENARSKGYLKGNYKYEVFFQFMKRETAPKTIYTKKSFDREDILEITSFNYVEYIKKIMTVKQREEEARAILFGDGRNINDPDKISEENIRPIWKDPDAYAIHKTLTFAAGTTSDARASEFIRTFIKTRKECINKGSQTLFIADWLFDDICLMKDGIGRDLYDSEERIKNKLRVNRIVTIPGVDNLTREVGGVQKQFLAIAVDLKNYTVGSASGSKGLFQDFDIDYNKMKYLLEDTLSGALTMPSCAIVMEAVYPVAIVGSPIAGTETILGKTVSSLQKDICVNTDHITGTLKYVTGYTQFSGDPEEQEGNYLALHFDFAEGATSTLQTEGESRIVTFDSDGNAVIRVKNNNCKYIVTSTKSGETKVSKFGVKLLKLEPKAQA